MDQTNVRKFLDATVNRCSVIHDYYVNLLYHTKYKKITRFSMVEGAHADEIVLLKGKLHNSGRAAISFKQLKKLSRITEYMLLFQKVKKTHEQISRLKRLNI